MFEYPRKLLVDANRILWSQGPRAVLQAGLKEWASKLDPRGLAQVGQRNAGRALVMLCKHHGNRIAFAGALRSLVALLERRNEQLSCSMTRNRAARAPGDYEYTNRLSSEDGVVPSIRPRNNVDYALEIPFQIEFESQVSPTVAVVAHCFYPDVLSDLLAYLKNIPCNADLFISTDTEQKFKEIDRICAEEWKKGTYEIRLFPNRGRDVAPKFIGFRDVYSRYELFLHVHSKKSPHGGEALSKWRNYLLNNLCGSREIVASILHLFEDETVGIVFPQHLFELRGILNWGYDFELAKALLRRMNVPLSKNQVLEFPSGSMFWGRSASIEKLLELELTFEDFPEETGQIDGTLAHAIERSLLFIVESAGYEWRKIVRREDYPYLQTILPVTREADLVHARPFVYQPVLSPIFSGELPSERAIPETRAILTYPSRNKTPRINLLVPTINPSQTFGGISTALRVFEELADQLNFDRRIVSTCAKVGPEALEKFKKYVLTSPGPSLDDERISIVDMYDRSLGRLDLRDGDLFIATAWWTAKFALQFNETRRASGVRPAPIIYLIQDDEPYFYGWSSKWVLAENTYHRGDETIAIINSEELYQSFARRYHFSQCFCLPYQINNDLYESVSAGFRERLIVFYGRPSVSRNSFELLLDGLVLWQQRNPITASKWRIASLGEAFDESWCFPVQNLSIVGKLSLQEYGRYLSTASVGVSLMVSPHPSYPPLEMAEAGLLTITNDFSDKRLASRFRNILPLDRIDPEALADLIEAAVETAEREIVNRRSRPGQQLDGREVPGSLYSASVLGDLLKSIVASEPTNS